MNQLAKLAGVSPVQISNYERDLQIPTAITLKEIAKALDTTMAFIIEGEAISEIEKLVPSIKKLSKSAQLNIAKYIKHEIYLASHKELDRKLSKELY